MRLENDTSHEIFADNFIRNRGKNFMKLLRKSGGSHFFDSLNRACQNDRRGFRYGVQASAAAKRPAARRTRTASSARVAVALGERVSPVPVPATRPASTAQAMASAA